VVWQSKAWFGWLDFWVEYLARYRDFRVAPVGKNIVATRSASGRVGYSGIFANPATPEKYGALVVLSRLPIPSSVLASFPRGTLVNQIYTDPLVHVPLGDKLELVQVLDRYAKLSGCAWEAQDALEVMPRTFDGSTEEGCRKFKAYASSLDAKTQRSELWVVKGPHHGGSAVNVMPARSVRIRFGECGASILRRKEIAQRLVIDTLLLDGRKLDVRVFVLVASTRPLLFFAHREPYFRATMHKVMEEEEEEVKESSSALKSQFITNTHIQKRTAYNFTEKNWQDHIWTTEKVQLYATRAGLPADFWERIVFPRVKRSVRVVAAAAAHTITERRPGQWKLFGVDFVIDAKFQPLLVDWNAFPGWDWSYRMTQTLNYRRRILGDTWRLVLDVQRGKALVDSRATPQMGGYELVYYGDASSSSPNAR